MRHAQLSARGSGMPRRSQAKTVTLASFWARLMNNENFIGYLLVAPVIMGLLIFDLYPVIESFRLSLTRGSVEGTVTWVGLENYQALMRDKLFWKSLGNTAYYTFAMIPAEIVLALAVALAVNQKLKGIVFFRTIYFLPVITSSVALSLMWLWIYNPKFGILNHLLSKVGITGIMWLGSPKTAMLALIIMAVWRGLGFDMLLFLAGLQGIPETLYEAARIDGAGSWARLRYVTVPLLSPTTFFIMVNLFIGGFQVFAYSYVMTNPPGAPAFSTLTLVLYLYQQAFMSFRMGYASAIAYILFFIILVMTIIQFRLQRQWVHYE
jgi:multiple sugar transport system permease protein